MNENDQFWGNSDIPTKDRDAAIKQKNFVDIVCMVNNQLDNYETKELLEFIGVYADKKMRSSVCDWLADRFPNQLCIAMMEQGITDDNN